jgi:hypothetical protein
VIWPGSSNKRPPPESNRIACLPLTKASTRFGNKWDKKSPARLCLHQGQRTIRTEKFPNVFLTPAREKLCSFRIAIGESRSKTSFVSPAATFCGATELRLSSTDSLIVTLCVGLSNFIWLPVMGALSDRIGRRPILITFTILALLTAYTAMLWLTSAPIEMSTLV